MNIYSACSTDEEISQGDIFLLSKEDINFLQLVESHDAPVVGFIVLSYDCDLTNNKLQYLSIAPILDLKLVIDVFLSKKRSSQSKQSEDAIKTRLKTYVDSLLKYNELGKFYLPICEDFKLYSDFIVFLEAPISIRLDTIRPYILKNRYCSLKNPWKEKLGWKMGSLYNRVSTQEYSEDYHALLINKMYNSSK